MSDPGPVATKARITKSRVALAAGAIALLGLAGLIALWWWGDDGPRLRTEASVEAPSRPDAPPVLVLLAPGTVVDDQPPEGWSGLVVKTITHLESGDINTLPSFARETATRFRTVILADVHHDDGRGPYHLRRVGAGLCLDLGGRDTVISSETAKSQGAALGTIDRMALGRAERALGRSHLAASTPTFALYDTFVELADASGAHHSIILRYALIVDPETGSLQSAYWTMAEHQRERTTPETLTLLAPGCVFRCGIHIAARRKIGKFAASWGFAMTKLPEGEPIAMPAGLREIAGDDSFEADSEALEEAVRAAIGSRVAPAVGAGPTPK